MTASAPATAPVRGLPDIPEIPAAPHRHNSPAPPACCAKNPPVRNPAASPPPPPAAQAFPPQTSAASPALRARPGSHR